MEKLFRLGQRNKPEVTVEQWAEKWKEALQQEKVMHRAFEKFMVEVNHPSPTSPPLTEERFKSLLYEHSQNINELDARRRAFEATKPGSQLARVHMEAVKSLRSSLEHSNNRLKVVVLRLQGDQSGVIKAQRDAEISMDVDDRIYEKLSVALKEVQRSNPDLFRRLDLPADVLSTYDLK